MSKFSAWFFGDPVKEDFGVKPVAPPSELAVKLARVIETSGDSWAFEDDQGHAHSYDLGITVSLKGDVVWQGSRDEHVRHASTQLMQSRCGTADANCIRDALQARRVRYTQAMVEKKQREAEEARVAREKRAAEAIDKLARGERLEDPFANRYADARGGLRAPAVPDWHADYYQRLAGRRGR